MRRAMQRAPRASRSPAAAAANLLDQAASETHRKASLSEFRKIQEEQQNKKRANLNGRNDPRTATKGGGGNTNVRKMIQEHQQAHQRQVNYTHTGPEADAEAMSAADGRVSSARARTAWSSSLAPRRRGSYGLGGIGGECELMVVSF